MINPIPSLALHLISKAQKEKAKYTKSSNSSIGKVTLNIVNIVVKMTVITYFQSSLGTHLCVW